MDSSTALQSILSAREELQKRTNHLGIMLTYSELREPEVVTKRLEQLVFKSPGRLLKPAVFLQIRKENNTTTHIPPTEFPGG